MTFSLPIRFHVCRMFRGFLAFVYLLLVSGAVLPPLLAPGGSGDIDVQDGLLQLQVALAITLIFVAFEFVRAFWHRAVGRILRAAWLPTIFVLLALLSSVWSVDPMLSLRRGVAVFGMLLVTVFLAAHFGYRRSVMLITWLLACVAVASLVTSLLLPSIGVHHIGSHLGRWKGVYLHKNLLGREMALAAGLFVIAAAHARNMTSRWLWMTFAVLALVLVFQTRSATGLVAAAIATIVAVGLHWGRSQPRTAAVLVLLGALAAMVLGFVAMLAPNRLFELVGRDVTFTGRNTLWAAVWDKVSDAPLFGHGYRAFWGSSGGTAISEDLGWRVTHAHNAILDVALSLGAIGVLIVLWLVLVPIVRWASVTLMQQVGSSRYFETGVVVAVTTLATSISDSILLGPNNLFLLLLFLQFIGPQSPSRAYAKGAAPRAGHLRDGSSARMSV